VATVADYDQVALDVLAKVGVSGAVRLEGYLGPIGNAADAQAIDTAAVPDTDGLRLRFFTDSELTEWWEFEADALLHQVQGAFNDGKSVIWLAREATITRCQSGTARQFIELESGETVDDPAARRPRPYP